MPEVFDLACRRCDRLARFLDEVKAAHPAYHCRPVEAFGDQRPWLLIVGLAPGLHGANATGRPFTGDGCSDFLYGALHRAGLSSAERSIGQGDGLQLHGMRITNAVKCLPPDNKPTPAEVNTCSRFLADELRLLQPQVVLTLGAVAHGSVVRTLRQIGWLGAGERPSFVHGSAFPLANTGRDRPGWLLASYHPSRYNLNTRRITQEMFDAVLQDALARRVPA